MYYLVQKKKPLLLPALSQMNSVLIFPYTLLTISFSILFFIIIVFSFESFTS